MGKNKKDNVDLQEAILTQIVTQFDYVSKFNDGQLEINKLLMERVYTLEKRIEVLEKKAEQLEKRVKETKDLAMIW